MSHNVKGLWSACEDFSMKHTLPRLQKVIWPSVYESVLQLKNHRKGDAWKDVMLPGMMMPYRCWCCSSVRHYKVVLSSAIVYRNVRQQWVYVHWNKEIIETDTLSRCTEAEAHIWWLKSVYCFEVRALLCKVTFLDCRTDKFTMTCVCRNLSLLLLDVIASIGSSGEI